MALTPLAGVPDLLAHAPAGFSPDMSKALAKLDAASDAVRDAAGSPITQAESTVRIVAAGCGSWLDLPGKPVVSVSSVTIEGEPVTGWRLLGSRLYRAGEWAHGSRLLPKGSDLAFVSPEPTHGLYGLIPRKILL
jgi:hypothetical protein